MATGKHNAAIVGVGQTNFADLYSNTEGPRDAYVLAAEALLGQEGAVTGVFGMSRPAVAMRWRGRIMAGAPWSEEVSAAR
jgi:hypothetical protein